MNLKEKKGFEYISIVEMDQRPHSVIPQIHH